MEQAIHGVREQYSLLASMVRRQELFVPMLGIWVASFGGALHAPVTTYFQVEVGASTVASPLFPSDCVMIAGCTRLAD